MNTAFGLSQRKTINGNKGESFTDNKRILNHQKAKH
jgi:hypothetical protein